MRKKFPLYGSWLLSLTLIFGMSTPISAQAESKTTAQVEAVQAKRQAVNSNIGISDRSRNRPMAFPDPYCEIADATDVIVEEITVVEFAGTEISNDDDDNVLIDKTDVVVEITAGDTYTISVEGNTNGDFETNIVAFIDWNQNGILDDAGEIYELGTLENSTGYDGVSVSMDITVPADAVPGQTRVRITKTYFDEFSDPIINPCGIEFDPWGMGIYPGYGQALDFTVNVGGGGTFPSPYCGITNGDDIIVHKITEVDFAGTNITNEDGVSPLIDKTDVVADVAVNDTYTLVVEDDAPQNYQSKAVAFIDWNQNGILDDAGEIYELGTLEYPTGHVSMDVTIPSDAVLGETRIRIVKTYFNEFSAAVINPCAIEFEQSSGIWPSLGQALDFTLNIEEDSGGGMAYCIPEGTNSGRYINNFSTTSGSENISNMGSGFSPDGYGDFYDTYTVAQEQGEDVAFEVDIEGGTAGFRIWVDWNQDGVFDTTEEVAYASTSYSADHTGSFTVPADALEGDTRMRIVSHWLSSSGDIDPCETGFTYGEFEDYKFTVEAGTGGGGGGPCSQGTASNNIENGWSNVSLLIYANDFVVVEDEEFTLEEMVVNFLLEPGFDIVSADIFFYEDTGGNGPGAEIPGTSSLGAVPVSQEIIDVHPAGFNLIEGIWTLDTPITFEGAAGDAVYWMGIEIEYAGASAFLETSSIYNTPNESYFSDDGGVTWTSGLVNFGDDMHGVITFSGQCEASGGGGGTACEQVFYDAVQPTGVGFSSGNAVANDITVAAGESFTMETMTFDVVNIAGLPSEFDLEIYEDNGSGGVGTTTGMTYHFDSSNMTFVENGTFSIYTQYTVTLTLPNIELTADASEDARYWLAIAADLTTTGDFTYWVSYDYVTNPDSYPSWQYNDTDGWFEYDGGSSEGIMTVSGICEGAGGGDECEWTVIVEDTSWGDEVEWELREMGGTVLLSGGGYGNGYYDEQSITAAGPLEFWITNDGFFGDNTPTYSVSNGTEVLVSGTLNTADTLTFSDLNCDSGGGDPCDAVDVPYVQDFETATPPDMPECTTVVNAGSGNNWVTSTDEYGDFTGTFLEYEYHPSEPADSWFFTQGINLEAGTDYEITYGYGSRAAAAFPENLKVAFGDDDDPDAMTNLIAEHIAILSGGDKIMNTVEFTATTSGVFYFGFQAFSGANEWYLYLDDIEIKEADGSPGGDDCDQGDDSNGFENGYNISASGTFRNADDFIVSAGNTLNVRSIVLNVFANEPVSSVNINFFEDDGGMPGSTIVESVSGLVPYAQVPIGSNFGYPIYGVYLEVDLNFAGGASGASYWMQPEAVTDVAFWEVTSLGSLGELIHTSEAMGPWMPDEDGVNHAVFKLHCEVVTAPDPGCLFDITASVEPITRVVLAGIDNTSSAVVNGSPALEDFTHIEGTMGQGTEYDIALEGNTDGNWTNYFTVWIDWDQNGVWEADEMYEIGSITNSTGTDGQQATGTITVPADAPFGSTTMRVIKSFGSSPTDPCGQYSFGQGEDYTIIVEEGVGIDDQSMTTFTYYPNPTSGIVNITANKDISSVSVVNILGQQVIATKSLDNGQVDLSALATGTYMFRVTFEDGSLETFKVLKE